MNALRIAVASIGLPVVGRGSELRPGIDPRRIASDLRLMVLGAFEEAASGWPAVAVNPHVIRTPAPARL